MSTFKLILLVVCAAIFCGGCGKEKEDRSIRIEVGTYRAEKVWCVGGLVEKDNHSNDTKWYSEWRTLPCVTSGSDYQTTTCTDSMSKIRSLRFQCYASINGVEYTTCPGRKVEPIVTTKTEDGNLAFLNNNCQID